MLALEPRTLPMPRSAPQIHPRPVRQRSPWPRISWHPDESTPSLRRLLTSLPALATGFAVVALLAIGPFNDADADLHKPWAWVLTPSLVPFLQHGLDRISSQGINLPVLATVALFLAFRRRSWRPLVLAAGAEAGFYFVGFLKIVFARPAPELGNPAFFSGGLFSIGREGVSFPSGHAAEAILIYGTVAYLVATYSMASARTVRVVTCLVGLEMCNAVLTSFYLGYHWVSDLAGGLLVGAFLLRLLIRLDEGALQVRFPA